MQLGGWSRSQRRHDRGRPARGDAAQNRGPWPNTRRWHSSWTTTVSSASGGARTRRHENDSRPLREQLPQRVRWSRMVTAAGLTPSAGGVAPDRALDRRAGAGGTRPRGSWRSSAGRRRDARRGARPPRRRRPLDARASQAGRAGTSRRRCSSPRYRTTPRRASAPRATSRPGRRLTVEVAAEPRLALGEKLLDEPLRVGPAAPAGGGQRDDDAAVGVDDDPQAAGPRRAAERVREVAAGQARDRGDLGDHGGGARRHPVRRRSRRPGRAPVSAPSRTASRPLTTTCAMPVG